MVFQGYFLKKFHESFSEESFKDTNLLTPILVYLGITYVRCQMRHICQKCHI